MTTRPHAATPSPLLLGPADLPRLNERAADTAYWRVLVEGIHMTYRTAGASAQQEGVAVEMFGDASALACMMAAAQQALIRAIGRHEAFPVERFVALARECAEHYEAQRVETEARLAEMMPTMPGTH